MIPPEVMAKIVKRFHWRLALADMSRNLIETEYDEHYFAVSVHGPYPRDTQTLSIRSIAKILGRSLPAAQYLLEEHRELVLLEGVCSVCQQASSELEIELRRQRDEVGGGDLLVIAGKTSLMVVAPRRWSNLLSNALQ
jgi:hypothetical protein